MHCLVERGFAYDRIVETGGAAVTTTSMKPPVVLITSASSRNGRQIATKLLLARGQYTIRLVDNHPSKLADLVAQGAEVVALDSMSSTSMAQACTCVDFVCLIIPSLIIGSADRTMFRNFIQVATPTRGSRINIQHVVFLSGLDHTFDRSAAAAAFKPLQIHYDQLQMLRRSGLPFTSFRPAWFHDNFMALGMALQVSAPNSIPDRNSTHGVLIIEDAEYQIEDDQYQHVAAVAVKALRLGPQLAGQVYNVTPGSAITEDHLVAGKVSGREVAISPVILNRRRRAEDRRSHNSIRN